MISDGHNREAEAANNSVTLVIIGLKVTTLELLLGHWVHFSG